MLLTFEIIIEVWEKVRENATNFSKGEMLLPGAEANIGT